jgi:hypothetical protein
MAVFGVDDTFSIVSENVITSSDSSGNWPILEVIFDLSGMSRFKDLEVRQDESSLLLLCGELFRALAELSFSSVWVSSSLENHIVKCVFERVFKMTSEAAKVKRCSIECAVYDLLF